METFEVLEKALALIEDEKNWCGRGWGSAGSLCAIHAIAQASGKEGSLECSEWPAYRAMRALLPARSVGDFNDTHTHAEVVALFRAAIRAEKRKAGVPIDIPAEEKTGDRVAA